MKLVVDYHRLKDGTDRVEVDSVLVFDKTNSLDNEILDQLRLFFETHGCDRMNVDGISFEIVLKEQ